MAYESPGEVLAGRYRRLRTIGIGGMARVHLAEDERLGRQVAVKQLHAESPDEAVARFGREAKVGASLNHPNLVSIYDIESDGESVLIVMEHVDGETLAQAIARGGLAPERVARVVGDVAAGLDHAHRQGVIHRDVKPANILLRRDGVAKLADLGIARAAEGTAITRTGTVMGSAAYMAPEQVEGGPAGPRSDVYALAAVAFEALSGEKARAGSTPVEIAHEVVSGPPPDLARAWPGAPRAAAEALGRGMARHPDDRHPSAGALAADLEAALGAPDAEAATAATAPLGESHGRAASAPPVADAGEPARSAAATSPLATRGSRRRAAVGEGTRFAGSQRPRSNRRLAGPAALLATLLAVGAVAALAGGGDDGDRSQRERAASPAQEQAGGSDGDRAAGAEQRSNERSAGDGSGSEDGQEEGAPAPETREPSEPAGDPAELNDQGFALMQEGRYEEAIPLLEQAVAQYPRGSQELTYAYALYNLGRSLRLSGRPDEAVPILERRLQIPDQTDTVEQELAAARAEAG